MKLYYSIIKIRKSQVKLMFMFQGPTAVIKDLVTLLDTSISSLLKSSIAGMSL